MTSSSSFFDLTLNISGFLDPHQLLKILDFYESKELYPKEQLLTEKIRLLSKTNMVAYAIEVYQQLHSTDKPPLEMEKQKANHLKTLQELKKNKFLQLFNDDHREELQKLNENWNTAYLSEHYKMTKEDLNSLYRQAKFYFECGQYNHASEQLKYFRALNVDPVKDLTALWGKLCADIVIANWDEATKDLSQLREAIENTVSPIKQLQQRAWFIHWSLFVYFAKPGGLISLLEQFLGNDRFLHTVQCACPWVYRYIVIASLITKTKQREVVRMIDHETYTDPILDFFKSIFGKYRLDEAEEKLGLCEPVLAADYFVNSNVDFTLKEDFLKAGKYSICEAFCTIHSTIDIEVMSNKLKMTPEEAECWIVNFIRSTKLEAKIDIANNLVHVQPNVPSVYQQVLEKTKVLMLRNPANFNQQQI